MNWKNLLLCAAGLVAGSVSAQTDWQFIGLEWYDRQSHNEFLGIFYDFEVSQDWSSMIGGEVASSDLEPPTIDDISSDIAFGNGVYTIEFIDGDDETEEDESYFLEAGFFSRSKNHFFGNGIGFDASTDDRQSLTAMTGFRIDAAATANPAGSWQGLRIEIGSMLDSGQLTHWGYEASMINISALNGGTGNLSFELIESSDEDEVGEAFNTVYTVQGNIMLVETGEDEPLELNVSAVGDIILERGIENEGNGMVHMGINTFMKPVSPGSLSNTDVMGVWAINYLELEAGDVNGQFPWYSMLSETGLIELREDGTGSYYTIYSSSAREFIDGGDLTSEFIWAIDGSEVHIGEEGDDGSGFVVSSSKEYARAHLFEDEGDYRKLELQQLIRVDGPIPPAVKAIPLFTPTAGSWGKFMDGGWMYIDSWPWVYTEIMGWQRVLDEGNGHFVWVYDLQLGWLRTDYDMFPWFYGDGAGEIYYVDVEASAAGNRKIYSVHEGIWVD